MPYEVARLFFFLFFPNFVVVSLAYSKNKLRSLAYEIDSRVDCMLLDFLSSWGIFQMNDSRN
jgi:hypothetical protein